MDLHPSGTPSILDGNCSDHGGVSLDDRYDPMVGIGSERILIYTSRMEVLFRWRYSR